MPKLPRLTARKLMVLLGRLGFVQVRQRGSHVVMGHADGRMTVVPKHSGDIPTGTLRGIMGDIEVSVEELLGK